MTRNNNFEITEVAGEYMAIPVGEEAVSFHGVVALNEAAAFLLKNMDEPRTKEELVDLLLKEYDTDRITAEKDVEAIIKQFIDLKLIVDA